MRSPAKEQRVSRLLHLAGRGVPSVLVSTPRAVRGSEMELPPTWTWFSSPWSERVTSSPGTGRAGFRKAH